MLCLVLLSMAAALTPLGDGLAIAWAKPLPDELTAKCPVEVVLENRSRKRIRLWDPKSVEGQEALTFRLKGPEGESIEVRPLFPPRAAGVPTSVLLEPGVRLRLAPVDLAARHQAGQLAKGRYEAIAIYRNRLADRAPVKGVWTGELRSKPFKVDL